MINIISIYDSKETIFTSNGLVVLSDCISCNVNEELNGLYELELEYPLDERGKWQYLLEDNVIKADAQLFRVYRKIKTLNSVKINARAIYYDLLSNLLEDVRPTNLSGASALDYILDRTQYSHPFTNSSDVGGSNTIYFVRKNPIEAITEIINTYGGELKRDNFEVKLLQARGLDRGVLVAYGKNVQGIEETLDMDSLCTRLMPVGKDGLLLTEKYVDSPYINNYPHPIIKVVEFTDIETETELRTTGQNYILDSKCDIPKFNYKIDFLELSKTEEYKNYAVLERVYLGDTITIKHGKLEMNLKAKVIKITKNILTDRIEKIELGSFKENIATAINKSIQEVKKEIAQVTSAFQKEIINATDLITGSKGGNVIIKRDANGKPIEIDVMDTDSEMTCVNVWRWNLNGFAHSSSGFAGPFTVGITADGHIIGSFITALKIVGEQIEGGIITGVTLNGVTINGSVINAINTLTIGGTETGGSPKIEFKDAWSTGSPTQLALSADGNTDTLFLMLRSQDDYRGRLRIGGFPEPNDHTTPIDLTIQGTIEATEGLVVEVWGGATIPTGQSVTINHNKGYKPIVQLDGTLGNCVLTIKHDSINSLRVFNVGTTWIGDIRLY